MILTAIFNFASWLIDRLPTLSIPELSLPSTIRDVITICWYFLPMDTIGVIFAIGVGITLFRLLLAVILRIKSFIPFISG